ncbi:MAG: hypothetical protein ACOYEP_10975 [Limnochordia bacterium]|jgi:hypothetical protein
MTLGTVFIVGVGLLAAYGVVRLMRGGSACSGCASCHARSTCGAANAPKKIELKK